MPYYLGPPITAAGKQKHKQTPRKNVETTSERVQGVALQPGVYIIVYVSTFPHIFSVMVPTCASTVVPH